MKKITRSNNFKWYWTKKENINLRWLNKQGLELEEMFEGIVVKIN